MKMAWIVNAAITIGLCLLAIFISTGYHYWSYTHPKKEISSANPSSFDMPYEEITFQTEDGVNLSGWFVSSKGAKGIVIVGHGYPFDKGNVLGVTKFLYPDYHLLYYDHRGLGKSAGKTSLGIHEPKDVDAAIHYIKQAFGDDFPIALFGISMSAASMLQSKKPVRAIVADSSYANLQLQIQENYKLLGPLKWPFVWSMDVYVFLFHRVWPKDVSPEHSVGERATPIMVIHGSEDNVISVEHAKRLKDVDPTIKLLIFEGAEHVQSHSKDRERFQREIKEFLSRVMS